MFSVGKGSRPSFHSKTPETLSLKVYCQNCLKKKKKSYPALLRHLSSLGINTATSFTPSVLNHHWRNSSSDMSPVEDDFNRSYSSSFYFSSRKKKEAVKLIKDSTAWRWEIDVHRRLYSQKGGKIKLRTWWTPTTYEQKHSNTEVIIIKS